tara:strand:+ start:24 stop:218 length:195 start_codon:yes stop_codon:yes gene_type:complete
MQRRALLLPRGVHVRGEAGSEGLQACRGQAAEAARGAARLAQLDRDGGERGLGSERAVPAGENR